MANITFTASSVKVGSAQHMKQTVFADAVIAVGDAVIISTTTGKAVLTDPADADLLNASGIALNAAEVGHPVTVVTQHAALETGVVLPPGAPIYLSPTPGKMTADLADVTTGCKPVLIGMSNGDETWNISCNNPMPFKAATAVE